MASVTGGSVNGAFLRMGNSVRDIDLKAGRLRPREIYDLFQADRDVALALRYPTDLKAISETNFDGIARHGYEIADAVLTLHSPGSFPLVRVESRLMVMALRRLPAFTGSDMKGGMCTAAGWCPRCTKAMSPFSM